MLISGEAMAGGGPGGGGGSGLKLRALFTPERVMLAIEINEEEVEGETLGKRYYNVPSGMVCGTLLTLSGPRVGALGFPPYAYGS